MPLILTSGPSAEPVSLDEAKLHCRVDDSTDDLLISSLILAARLHVERSLDIALISQSWSLYLDNWPDATFVETPIAPLISVDAVRVYGADGAPTTVDPADYIVDGASRRPRIARHGGAGWPRPGRALNGIEIAFTAGYGPEPEDTPMPVRQAIRMLVAHWYEAREAAVPGDAPETVPLAVSSLIAPYRSPRL